MFLCFIEFVRDLPKLEISTFDCLICLMQSLDFSIFFFVQRNNLYVAAELGECFMSLAGNISIVNFVESLPSFC